MGSRGLAGTRNILRNTSIMMVPTVILLVMGGMADGSCASCRTVIGGDTFGRYQLVTENDIRCPDGCLYRRDVDLHLIPPNTESRYCFTKGYKITKDCAVALKTTTKKPGLIPWAPYKNIRR